MLGLGADAYLLRTLAITGILAILGTIDFVCLLASYWVLRLLRVSVRWVTWSIGLLIAVWSVWLCGALLLRPYSISHGISNLLGAISFLIAVFAVSQWTTRRGYLIVKRWPGAFGSFVARQTRGMLLYLRDHHQFFGWLVLIAAMAHTALLLPIVGRLSQREVVTGVIALVSLAALTALGEWVEIAVRRKRIAPNVRLLHALCSIAFLVAFAFHA